MYKKVYNSLFYNESMEFFIHGQKVVDELNSLKVCKRVNIKSMSYLYGCKKVTVQLNS